MARALQQYGMFDGDNGGAMALMVQLLAPSGDENYRKWKALFPASYESVTKIPTDRFRVVYTGEPIIKK